MLFYQVKVTRPSTEAPPPWLQPPPTLTEPPRRLAEGDSDEKESFFTFIHAERIGFVTHSWTDIKVFLYTILLFLFLNHIISIYKKDRC